MEETQDFKIGQKYCSKKRRVVRTLIQFSDCGKYGLFKCESSTRVYERWLFLFPWGSKARMIERALF